MYLDIDIFVNFNRLAENENVLHEICKLPHVSELVEETKLLRRRRRLHLCPTTFTGYHDDEAPRAET